MIIKRIILRIKKYREEYDLKKTTLMKTPLMKIILMKTALMKIALMKIALMKCYKKINLIKKLIYPYLRHNCNNKDLFEFI